GPHHAQEIQVSRKMDGLLPPNLFQHGYGVVDSLLKHRKENPVPFEQVLVAPSWGSNSLLNAFGEELLNVLKKIEAKVVIRPHPVSCEKDAKLIRNLRKLSQDSPNIQWDFEAHSKKSFLESAIMITEWSGSALEFAFGLERPVLFIDSPRKINNPDY